MNPSLQCATGFFVQAEVVFGPDAHAVVGGAEIYRACAHAALNDGSDCDETLEVIRPGCLSHCPRSPSPKCRHLTRYHTLNDDGGDPYLVNDASLGGSEGVVSHLLLVSGMKT